MKRSMTLLLLSLLLAFTLTACGREDMQDNTSQNGNTVTDNGATNGTGSNGNGVLGNGTTDNGTANAGGDNSLAGDVGNAVTDGIDDVKDGMEDVGDAITGNDTNRTEGTANKTRSAPGGVTYEQMLRNARVHDTDGKLMDRENAVSSGSTY